MKKRKFICWETKLCKNEKTKGVNNGARCAKRLRRDTEIRHANEQAIKMLIEAKKEHILLKLTK